MDEIEKPRDENDDKVDLTNNKDLQNIMGNVQKVLDDPEKRKMLTLVQKLMDSSVNESSDPRINLLNAIKPFLKPKRQRTLDSFKQYYTYLNVIKTQEEFNRINKEEQAVEVHLVNTSRYYKDYPSNNLNIHGYSHIKAELKSARFDGLEFFCSSPEYIYKRKDGKLTTKKEGNKLYYKAFPVGLVPYDWIDHIDIGGDEYGYVPQFFCSFKGSIYWKNSLFNKIFRGYPYSKIMYYIESDVFHSNNDPFIMKYMRIKEPILKT